MSVTFDSLSASGVNNLNVSSLTWSHTTNAGATLLLVGVADKMSDGTSNPVTGVTFNAIPLTLIGTLEFANRLVIPVRRNTLTLYGLVNPPIATANIIVSWTASKLMGAVTGGVSWGGTALTLGAAVGPVVTSRDEDGSTALSLTIPLATAGGVPFALYGVDLGTSSNTAATPGADETQLWNTAIGSFISIDRIRGGASYQLPALDGIMDWTLVVPKLWGMLGLEIRPPVSLAADIRLLGVGM